jgi:hypothetical protein
MIRRPETAQGFIHLRIPAGFNSLSRKFKYAQALGIAFRDGLHLAFIHPGDRR